MGSIQELPVLLNRGIKSKNNKKMLLKDLFPNKTKTVVSNFYLKVITLIDHAKINDFTSS